MMARRENCKGVAGDADNKNKSKGTGLFIRRVAVIHDGNEQSMKGREMREDDEKWSLKFDFYTES